MLYLRQPYKIYSRLFVSPFFLTMGPKPTQVETVKSVDLEVLQSTVTPETENGEIKQRHAKSERGPVVGKKIFERDPCFKWTETPMKMEDYNFNRIWMAVSHSLAACYLYMYFTSGIQARTWIFEFFYGYLGGLGITVGAHRYWCHKTFKAKKPLQYLLMAMQTIGGQYPIWHWAIQHRIHHKYTDTDADPHNSKKGFWWSHWVWIFYPRHPEFKRRWKTMDMSDIENDPIVRFQGQYYWELVFLLNLLIPVTIVMYIYDVPLFYAICSAHARVVYQLHVTWTVNSVAHKFGDRPYEKNIRPTDNMLVSLFTIGEGWHNFHHAFPWDYKAAEFGWKVNVSTMFIDFFAWIGWAYDLKMVSKQVTNARVKRTGDGTHWTVNLQDREMKINGNNNGNSNQENAVKKDVINIEELQKSMDHPSWGWDDKSDTMDVWRHLTTVLNPEKTK